MTRLAFLFLAAGLLLAKPNLNATWKLDTSKSDFGPLPQPDSMTRKVTDDGKEISIAAAMVVQGNDLAWNATLKSDGTEQSFQMGGSPAKGVMKWQGEKLLFLTKRDTDQGEVRQDEEWSVSPDGKTLTVNIKITLPDGNTPALRMIYDRQ
jgi:hypothetical protein